MHRRASLLTVLAMLGMLVTAPAVQAAPPTSPFSGHWEATDPFDGSNLDAFISGGSHPQILYTDDEAAGACGDLSDQAFTSFLTGTIAGEDVNTTMRWARCGAVHLFLTGLTISWTIDDQGDTEPWNDVLTNSFGETYTRA